MLAQGRGTPRALGIESRTTTKPQRGDTIVGLTHRTMFRPSGARWIARDSQPGVAPRANNFRASGPEKRTSCRCRYVDVGSIVAASPGHTDFVEQPRNANYREGAGKLASSTDLVFVSRVGGNQGSQNPHRSCNVGIPRIGRVAPQCLFMLFPGRFHIEAATKTNRSDQPSWEAGRYDRDCAGSLIRRRFEMPAESAPRRPIRPRWKQRPIANVL